MGKDHLLELEGMDFDVSDKTTYTILCTVDPTTLWQDLLEERGQNNQTVAQGQGPFRISLDRSDRNVILFPNKSGKTTPSSIICSYQVNSTKRTKVTHYTDRLK